MMGVGRTVKQTNRERFALAAVSCRPSCQSTTFINPSSRFLPLSVSSPFSSNEDQQVKAVILLMEGRLL